MTVHTSMNLHRVDSVKITEHDSAKDVTWRQVIIKGEGFKFRITMHGRDGQQVLAVHETNEHDCCFLKDES